MERDIAKKTRRTLRRTCCKVRLGPVDKRMQIRFWNRIRMDVTYF
jgi:hypothetical protein